MKLSLKSIAIASAILLTTCPAFAQFSSSASFEEETKSSDFNPQQLIAPAALVTTGTLIHCFAHDTWDVQFRESILNLKRVRHIETPFDDWSQYFPAIAAVGLGLFDVPAEHNFAERTIETGLATVSLVVIAESMKRLISSPRPNGVDDRSFPSGHTATAFMGAELVRMEYGWGWGSAAYLVAGATAFMRVYNDEHWMSDLFAGAGIGLLCAHIGGWLLEPVKSLVGMDDLAVSPSIDPMTGSVGAALALRF